MGRRPVAGGGGEVSRAAGRSAAGERSVAAVMAAGKWRRPWKGEGEGSEKWRQGSGGGECHFCRGRRTNIHTYVHTCIIYLVLVVYDIILS